MQRRENIILAVIAVIGLFIVGLIIYHDKKLDSRDVDQKVNSVESSNNKDIETSSESDKFIEEVPSQEDTTSEQQEEKKSDTINETKKEKNSSSSKKNSSSSNSVSSNSKTTTTSKTDKATKSNSDSDTQSKANYSEIDQKAIATFSNIESEVDSLLKSGNDESVKDKAKGVFITLVDFIFYDGTINGMTFDSLTDAGKQKVLSITSSIDSKIEKKFPKYKESISSKTKNAFNKASDVIKSGANNINNFAKEKLGDKYYQEIIEDKDELVKYTKNAFSIVGKVGSNLLTKGKDSISAWYQKFKNSSK